MVSWLLEHWFAVWLVGTVVLSVLAVIYTVGALALETARGETDHEDTWSLFAAALFGAGAWLPAVALATICLPFWGLWRGLVAGIRWGIERPERALDRQRSELAAEIDRLEKRLEVHNTLIRLFREEGLDSVADIEVELADSVRLQRATAEAELKKITPKPPREPEDKYLRYAREIYGNRRARELYGDHLAVRESYADHLRRGGW